MKNKMGNNKFNKMNIFRRFPLGWLFVLVIFILLVNSANVPINGLPKEMTYGSFLHYAERHPGQD